MLAPERNALLRADVDGKQHRSGHVVDKAAGDNHHASAKKGARVDIAQEQSRRLTAFDDRHEDGDELRQLPRRAHPFLDGLVAMNVFGEPQAGQMRPAFVLIEDVFEEQAYRRQRLETGVIGLQMLARYPRHGFVQHRDIQLVLVLVVVVDQLLGDTGAPRDFLDARAGEAGLAEFIAGGVHDAFDTLLWRTPARLGCDGCDYSGSIYCHAVALLAAWC